MADPPAPAHSPDDFTAEIGANSEEDDDLAEDLLTDLSIPLTQADIPMMTDQPPLVLQQPKAPEALLMKLQEQLLADTRADKVDSFLSDFFARLGPAGLFKFNGSAEARVLSAIWLCLSVGDGRDPVEEWQRGGVGSPASCAPPALILQLTWVMRSLPPRSPGVTATVVTSSPGNAPSPARLTRTQSQTRGPGTPGLRIPLGPC